MDHADRLINQRRAAAQGPIRLGRLPVQGHLATEKRLGMVLTAVDEDVVIGVGSVVEAEFEGKVFYSRVAGVPGSVVTLEPVGTSTRSKSKIRRW